MEAGALIRALSRVHILVDILTSFCLTPGLSPASTCPMVSVEFSGTAASQTCSPKHILRFRGCLCSPFAGCHDGNSFSPPLSWGAEGGRVCPQTPGKSRLGRSAGPGLPLFLEKGWAWGQAFTPRPSGAA